VLQSYLLLWLELTESKCTALEQKSPAPAAQSNVFYVLADDKNPDQPEVNGIDFLGKHPGELNRPGNLAIVCL